MTQPNFDNSNELIVDNFAGGGGASLGIEWALGRPIDIAINHDPEAIAMHKANHPHTRHYCESVWDVDPLEVTGGRPVLCLWASPDCRHFSRAKGSRPVNKNIRALAWVVVKWAKAVRPRLIVTENVESFRTWGPLLENDKPCPVRAGKTFQRWKRQIEKLGYVVEYRELRACDYGAPTIRNRLFVIARCDGKPIVWPKPTHGPGTDKPYHTAAEIIDWSISCPSIFERKKPLAPATLRRIAKGMFRYVINSVDPFIVPNTHAGDDRVHSIHDPLRTVTAANRGELSLSVPTLIQTGYGERVGQAPRVPSLEKPLGTVVNGQKHALVAAHLTKFQQNSIGTRADDPTDTVLAGAQRFGLVAAYLKKFGTGSVGSGMDDPVHTVTAGSYIKRAAGAGHAMGLATAFLAQHNTGMVGHDARTPVSTILSKGCTQGLVTSNLIKFYGTSQHGQHVCEPLATVTANGWHLGEVRAFLYKYYGTDQDLDLRDPLHTVTTKDRFALVTIRGVQYVIADIGLRMLQPRELFRAQGFPEGYIIDPMVMKKRKRGNTISFTRLSKTAQVRMCGNSVPPQFSKALVEANLMPAQEEVEQAVA